MNSPQRGSPNTHTHLLYNSDLRMNFSTDYYIIKFSTKSQDRNVVVEGQALDVGHIVGPLNYSRCDTKHRLPCTITPFY